VLRNVGKPGAPSGGGHTRQVDVVLDREGQTLQWTGLWQGGHLLSRTAKLELIEATDPHGRVDSGVVVASGSPSFRIG
jgi:hypothetical protein